MAYFPNGMAGEAYIERYCLKCVNWRDLGDGRGPGCAIWDAHLLYSYEECNNDGKDGRPHSNAKDILDLLIPNEDDGFPAQCSMFIEGVAPPPTQKIRPMKCMEEWAKKNGMEVT